MTGGEGCTDTLSVGSRANGMGRLAISRARLQSNMPLLLTGGETQFAEGDGDVYGHV